MQQSDGGSLVLIAYATMNQRGRDAVSWDNTIGQTFPGISGTRASDGEGVAATCVPVEISMLNAYHRNTECMPHVHEHSAEALVL